VKSQSRYGGAGGCPKPGAVPRMFKMISDVSGKLFNSLIKLRNIDRFRQHHSPTSMDVFDQGFSTTAVPSNEGAI
jgi:hypothetical protein